MHEKTASLRGLMGLAGSCWIADWWSGRLSNKRNKLLISMYNAWLACRCYRQSYRQRGTTLGVLGMGVTVSGTMQVSDQC